MYFENLQLIEHMKVMTQYRRQHLFAFFAVGLPSSYSDHYTNRFGKILAGFG